MSSKHEWYESLEKEESELIRDLIWSDFKIKTLCQTKNMSYFLLKKQLDKVRSKVLLEKTKSSEFKTYLDFLVEQEILLPILAREIYTRHLNEKE